MTRRSFAILRMAAVAVCLAATAAAGAYQNPARGVVNIGDPGLLKHGDTYYLYPTANTYNGGKPDVGVRVWTSTDLVDWKPGGWALLAQTGDWAQHEFLGPEVHYRLGQFYMVYSAKDHPDNPSRVCIAIANSPLGPFSEYRAPLFTTANVEIEASLFTDYDGRSYLYYASLEGSSIRLRGREISTDLTTFIGPAAVTVLGPPYSAWEMYSPTFSVTEAPQLQRTRTGYTLTYSGNAYLDPDYALGCALGSSPLGTFTRLPSNPILARDAGASPPISGPGSHNLAWSPDGTEPFFVYHAHTNPAAPGGDRSVYIDRVALASDGSVSTTGPTNTVQPDPSADALPTTWTLASADDFSSGSLEPPASPTGWSAFGTLSPGLAEVSYDTTAGAYLGTVSTHPSKYRIAGVQSNLDEWLPYASVGPSNFVRVKYHLFHTGQANPADANTIPNFRVRASVRFAMSSMLEVFHHLAADPGNAPLAAELRPSADPLNPSLYRVDLDPLDVPYLADNATTEGVLRVFETYALEPQENGSIGMTESEIGVYPAIPWPAGTETGFMPSVYQVAPGGAGNLAVVNAASEVALGAYTLSPDPGEFPQPDGAATKPTHVTNASGITLDSTMVASNRVGIASREIFPGPEAGVPVYPRVEEGRQYAVRFHITSTQQANRQAQVRLRARSVKFAWSQKFEIGGAWAAGAANNTIAQQALPGIGTLNPDRDASENGGWYSLLMHTPLSPGIRPEFPPGTPLAARMPLLSAQPGPTFPQPSRRDLRIGLDIIDTISGSPQAALEQGHVTVDRIEVRSIPLVAD